MKEHQAEIGIIGGTGIYDPELLTNAESIKIFTPYGKTSDLVTIGQYKVALLRLFLVMVRDIRYLRTR